MSTKNKQDTYSSIEDYEENCSLCSPSISKRRCIGGKSYYIRRYFRGSNDFEIAMRTIAERQVNKKNAG